MLTVAAPGVMANDTDADPYDTLNAGTPSDPAHGTATIDNLTGRLVYTPDANYSGPDSFTYLIGDYTIVSNVATVSINVTPVNDAPVAVGESFTIAEDSVLTGNLLANDSDPDPDARLNVSTPSDPAHGTVTVVNATGAFTYTPDAGYNGPDSFTYFVGDYSVASNTVTVEIDITAVNDGPSFTKGSDIAVTTGPGPQSYPNWASAISSGEADQTVDFAVTTERPELFSVQPTIDSAGTLSFTAGSCGASFLAQATATDNGVPVASSAAQTFRISIYCPTTTTVTFSSNPAAYGAPVRMLVNVVNSNGEAITEGYSLVTVDDFTLYANFSEFQGGYDLSGMFALPVGERLITVSTSPGGFNAQSSASTTLIIAKADTTASFTTSANPARVGEPVTFRASVASPNLTPDGTVTFLNGTTVLGTGTLANGVATFTTSSLPVGNSVISVRYEGTGSFNGSVSAPGTQVVRPGSSTALTLSAPTSIFGQGVTLTANVPGATGNVTFLNGTTVLGTRPLRSGAASLIISNLPVGSRMLTAVYGGSVGLDGSVSPAVTHTVSQAQTAATLTVNPGATVFGQTVTLSATISVTAPGGGTPTGTVSFYDGTTLLGTKNLGGGRAVFTTSTLAVGSHGLRAEYVGSSSHAGSATATTTLAVNSASTTTTLATSATSAVTGQKVTLTAAVAAVAPGKGTPAGSIVFRDGATELATVALSGGRASRQVTLPVGSHSLTAEYIPANGNFTPSTGTASLVVSQASTTTTLTSSGTPALFGRKVTFTATLRVTAPGAGAPSGTMTFRDGNTVLGAVSITNGRATWSGTSLARGAHSITATYSGDAGYSASTSSALMQQIN